MSETRATYTAPTPEPPPCLSPADVAARLLALAQHVRLAYARPDLVTPEGALQHLAVALEDLAWRVEPS